MENKLSIYIIMTTLIVTLLPLIASEVQHTSLPYILLGPNVPVPTMSYSSKSPTSLQATDNYGDSINIQYKAESNSTALPATVMTSKISNSNIDYGFQFTMPTASVVPFANIKNVIEVKCNKKITDFYNCGYMTLDFSDLSQENSKSGKAQSYDLTYVAVDDYTYQIKATINSKYTISSGDTVYLDPTINISSLDFSLYNLITRMKIETNTTHIQINDSSGNFPWNKLYFYYPADDDAAAVTTARTIDYSANNLTGTKNAAALVSNISCGLYGLGFCFNAVTGFSITRVQTITANQNYTAMAWINTRDNVRQQVIFQQPGNVTKRDDVNLYIKNGNITFTINTTASSCAGGNVTINASLPLNTWHHFAVSRIANYSFNDSNYSIYIDGILNVSVLCNGSLATGGTFSFGYDLAQALNPFNGSMDELMYFNASLSTPNITAIYNNQSNRFYPSGTVQLMRTCANINGYSFANVSLQNYQRYFGTNISMSFDWADLSEGYNETYLAPDNYAHYPLDGNYNDTSGHSRNATSITNSGYVWNNTQANQTYGIYLQTSNLGSTTFNGNNNLTGNYLRNGWTVMAWVKCNGTCGYNGGYGYFYAEGYAGQNLGLYTIGVGATSTGYGYCETATSSAQNTQYIGSTYITDTQWHFIACTLNSTNQTTGYLDGVPTYNTGYGSPSATYSYIGGPSGYGWNGSIDDLILVNRSLNYTEIKDIMIHGYLNWHHSDMQNLTATVSTDNVSMNGFRMGQNSTCISLDFLGIPSPFNFYSPLIDYSKGISINLSSNYSAPTWSNFIATPASPKEYNPGQTYTFSLDWTTDNTMKYVYLIVNNATYVMTNNSLTNFNATINSLPAGNSTFEVIAYDSYQSANNIPMFTYNITTNSSYLPLNITFSPSNVVSSGTMLTITGINAPYSPACNLTLAGNSQTNPWNNIFGVGQYYINYSCVTSQNYSGSETGLKYFAVWTNNTSIVILPSGTNVTTNNGINQQECLYKKLGYWNPSLVWNRQVGCI